MKKTVLLLLYFLTASAHATAYWCPATIVCAGVDVITCQKSTWNDFWQLDYQHYANILDPYFQNTGATFDAYHMQANCNYRNSSSQGLSLIPISGKLFPFVQAEFNWQWEDETHSWAYCNGHDQCPFSDSPVG